MVVNYLSRIAIVHLANLRLPQMKLEIPNALSKALWAFYSWLAKCSACTSHIFHEPPASGDIATLQRYPARYFGSLARRTPHHWLTD